MYESMYVSMYVSMYMYLCMGEGCDLRVVPPPPGQLFWRVYVFLLRNQLQSLMLLLIIYILIALVFLLPG